jgi:hypothetical protein
MNIPEHLRHLPTWKGLPVPYVNHWGTGEPTADWSIRFDRTLRQIAAFCADHLDGPADFTRQCVQRQRECALLGLCQVCKRTLDWPDRRLAVSSISTETVQIQDRRVPVLTEPWLCEDCASFAILVCPSLIRRGRHEDLHVVTMSGPEDCKLVLSSGWIEGPLEAATQAHPVAMWVKILLLNVDIQFSKEVRA